MPVSNPQTRDLHVDALLSSFSVQYINEQTAYVADKVFPIISVRKQSDKYATYLKSQFFRDVAMKRTPGMESTGAPYEVDTSNNYFCENYVTNMWVPDEDRENADQPFDPDIDATILCTDRLLLRREIDWATDFFKTGVWATDKTGGASGSSPDFVQWSDYTNSDPILDIENAKTTAYSTTAIELNKLLLSRQVWTKLKHHPDFIERIKYTQRGVLTLSLVQELLELDSLWVAKAIKTTSAVGVAEASATFDYIFGKHALLFYTPETPTKRRPSAGYTFHWTVFNSGLSYIRRLRNDFRMSDMIEGHTFYDQKKIAADCGYFFNAAVA